MAAARSPPAQSDERNDVHLFPGGGEALVFVMRGRFALGDDRRRNVIIGIDSKFMNSNATLSPIASNEKTARDMLYVESSWTIMPSPAVSCINLF